MAKLAVFTFVLFLACISQVFTFPGLHLAIGKTQTDIKPILSNILTNSEESVEDESADSSVSDVSDDDIVDVANSSVSENSDDSEDSEEDVFDAADSSVSDDSNDSEVSEEDVVDAADSPVSEETGDINNGGIRGSLVRLITFFRNLFKFESSDSSEDNEVSDNSEAQVVDDEESSEDNGVQVVVVKIADLEESINPDFIVDSKVTYDEVPHASESSSSEDSEASEVLENLDETSN